MPKLSNNRSFNSFKIESHKFSSFKNLNKKLKDEITDLIQELIAEKNQ